MTNYFTNERRLVEEEATQKERARCLLMIDTLKSEMRVVSKMLQVNHDKDTFGWMAAVEKLSELEQKIAKP